MIRRGGRGFAYGYYGGWWGWGPVYGLGLGLIAGVALAGLFFGNMKRPIDIGPFIFISFSPV